MARPRISLAQFMVVVAIMAADCGLIRLIMEAGDEQGAVCAVGLAVSPLLIVVYLARHGRVPKFAAGFVVTALLVAIALILVLLPADPRFSELWNEYYNFMIRWLPDPLADASKWQPVDASGTTRPGLTAKGAIVCIAMVAFPMFSLAVCGGMVSLAASDVGRTARTPHPTRSRHEPHRDAFRRPGRP